MFYPDGKSLGQRSTAVQSQKADPTHSKFVENLRWSIGGMTFVTLHIVGSNDNLGRTPLMDMEHAARSKVVLAWKLFGNVCVYSYTKTGRAITQISRIHPRRRRSRFSSRWGGLRLRRGRAGRRQSRAR